MAHETIQWGTRQAKDAGRRERSEDNAPKKEPSLLESLGLDRPRAAVPQKIEAAPRDSLDGLDLGLLVSASPGRRISSVPAIRARISVPPANTSPAPAYDFLAPAPAAANDNDDDFELEGLPSRRTRSTHAAWKWAAAFAVSIVTGGLAGRASRQHPMRATAVHVATAVAPPAAMVRSDAPSTAAHAAPVGRTVRVAAVAPVAPATPVALVPELPKPAAPTLDEPAPAVAPVNDDQRHGHRHHHGRHAEDAGQALAPTALAAPSVAPVAAPPIEPSVAPIAAPVARATEPEAPSTRAAAAPTATGGGPSSECTARCHGDLSCAADCVVHGARVARAAEVASVPAAPAAEPTLRVAPARDEVVSAIDSVRGAVRACAGDDTRTAFLTITFASSGRVTTALAEAPYAGTPAGSCMARAARSATVSPFSHATFSVRTPFAMR